MCRTVCTEPQCLYSTAIPLLPLCAVRPVQSLSACTRMNFTFTYTSTPPMDRTTCTEPQCLYKGALYRYLYLYSPYGPYGLYRASVSVQYSYTSTTLMGRTACTEPRCLYSTAIPLLPLWAVRPVHTLGACTRVNFTFTFKTALWHSKMQIQ